MNISHSLKKLQSANSQYGRRTIDDFQSECLSHMAKNGIHLENFIDAKGQFHRFPIGSKRNRDGWYVAWNGISANGNPYLICIYGSWKIGGKFEYRSWSENSLLDEEERRELQKHLKELRDTAEETMKAEQDLAAKECQRIWKEAENVSPTEGHLEYLKNKGVKNYGIRFGNNREGYQAIIIPLRNLSGDIRSLQYISVGQDGKVYKSFHTGGEKKGNFFVIGSIVNGGQFYVCEGYATGASPHEAIGHPVVVAFDCNNLSPVIERLRKAYPDSKITILADDDRETTDQQGNVINPGKNATIEAVRLHGCDFILPEFPKDLRLSNGKLPSDFNDLHVHISLDEVKRQLGDIQKVTENWDPPTQLPEGLPPVASLEADMIPEALRDWLLDIAERMQIPPDFSAAAAVVILGSLIGRKLGMHPKEKDDWVVVPNLWGAIVGRPSLMKSPAISEIMKPLNQFVFDAKAKYDKEMEKHELVKMKIKAQKGAFEDALKKAARDKGGEDKLNVLIASSPKIETSVAPVERRYKTEDGTIEKIAEILLQNPRGILIHRDELTGWFKSLDKDNREGDRAFFLESWNGTGGFTVDRIGRGTLHIPALCLSLLGGIQPGPLSSYVYQATKGGVGDDGLLQRFQLTVWPDALKEWTNVDRWPDTNAKNRAYEVFKRIDSYKHPLKITDSSLDIPAVRFSPEGQQVFNLWREGLEKRIRSGDLSPSMEAHLAKYRSLMPCLALIFQFCQDTDCCREIKLVERSSAELAVCWCKYLETHAHRLYASAENPALESARALLQRLKKGSLVDGFALRDVYRSDWSKLSSLEEAKSATDILVEYGWIRCEEKRTSTKPKKMFMLHPQLRQET